MGNLSNSKINALIRRENVGDYTDGGGLRLRIKSPRKGQAGAVCGAVWIFAYRIGGKQKNMQLGNWPSVDTFDARERKAQVKEALEQGVDPSGMFKQAEVRVEQADSATITTIAPLASLRAISTFSEVAHRHHANIRDSLKSDKYRRLWIASLRPAFAAFGAKAIREVTVTDIEQVLRPNWTAKHVTAKRLAQRIEQVFEFARGAGVLPANQPSFVKAAIAVMPRHEHEETHFASLSFQHLPEFWDDLERREAMSARCLQWIILTATRSQEARGARWAEIDEGARTWTIPGSRIKTRKMKSHTVQLTKECFDLLEKVRGVDGVNPLIFPADSGGEMSVNVFRPLFRRMGREGLTAHGFRATYRAFCEEMTDVDPSIIEMSYGHVVGSVVERAYRREAVRSHKISALMSTWTRYATGKVTLAELDQALNAE